MAIDDAHRIADATVAAIGATAVTKSDSADIFHTRGLYIGSVGDVKVTMVNGDVVTFYGAQTGSILPIQVTRVWSTGTTALNIVALY